MSLLQDNYQGPPPRSSRPCKKQEIAKTKLAAHIACHSRVNTIDHLSKYFWQNYFDTSHKVKCIDALITNVLDFVMSSELFSDVRSVPYSLIIDESTDVGTEKKQLAIVVHHLSNQHNKKFITFLDIVNITGTAEAIFQALWIY